MLKRFYLARINYTLDPSEQNETFLNSIMKEIAKASKPSKFSPGDGNVLIAHQQSFENSCALIEKHYHIDASALTVYKFISRIEHLKEEFKREAKQSKAATPKDKKNGTVAV